MHSSSNNSVRRLLDEVVLKGGSLASVAPAAFTYDAQKVADELFNLSGENPAISPNELAALITPAMLRDVVEKIGGVYVDAFQDSRYAGEQYYDMLQAWVKENLPEAARRLNPDDEE